jgi:PAS domain S-box-containing protein
VEYRIVQPGGEVRFVRSVMEAIRNDRGALVRIAGATQDITEEVHARELLRESERRLKRAERLAHVGNWHWDLQTGQLFWSEELFRILGRSSGYAPSYDRFLEAVVPQDAERVDRWVRDCLVEKTGSSIEFRIARPDGDVRTVNCASEVLPGESGLPARMFCACQDVTEVRRAQEESFARQRLETVGTLAGGIAHDFNNLLGGVLAQADLAQAEYDAGASPKEELKAIRDVAIGGSEIVRQLMIYAGKETEALGPVDVSQIVREMTGLLKVSVSKHATVETDLGKDLPAVRASAAQIRRIVMNLVTNASEAIGGRDGAIRVTTRQVALDRAAAIAKDVAEGDYLQLEISDNGRGMSRETQTRVFDPFYTTKSAGHGLGLAVVHGIVRGLGGAIQLTSEEGMGATFWIWLPATGDAAGETGAVADAGEPARPSPGFTLLLVEDEDPLRNAVVKMLRKAGVEVLEAPNGSAAIELLRANGSRIDVVLLDVTIPGASSDEVIVEVARARPEIGVILTSAYSEEMLTSRMSASPIRGFIRKPYQIADLLRTLRGALSPTV